MHNINHKWSMAVFESILFHVFLIAFLVAAGSFFMDSLPESSPIEVDLVDTTAGASGGAGSGSGHGSSVSKSDTVNVNQLPGGESKDSSAVSSDMASYEDNNEYSQNINTSTGGSGAADGSAQGSGSGNGTGSGSGSGNGTGSGSGDGTGTGYGSGTGSGSGDGIGNGNGEGSGGGVTEGPQILSREEPVYPSAARSAGISGTTVVGFIIEADGSVSSAWVEQSSGNSSLDSAAVQSVQNWRFVPARQNGIPVQSRSRVPIIFNLR